RFIKIDLEIYSLRNRLIISFYPGFVVFFFFFFGCYTDLMLQLLIFNDTKMPGLLVSAGWSRSRSPYRIFNNPFWHFLYRKMPDGSALSHHIQKTHYPPLIFRPCKSLEIKPDRSFFFFHRWTIFVLPVLKKVKKVIE